MPPWVRRTDAGTARSPAVSSEAAPPSTAPKPAWGCLHIDGSRVLHHPLHDSNDARGSRVLSWSCCLYISWQHLAQRDQPLHPSRVGSAGGRAVSPASYQCSSRRHWQTGPEPRMQEDRQPQGTGLSFYASAHQKLGTGCAGEGCAQ